MIVQALSALVTEAMRDAHTKSVAVRACLAAMNHCCLVACPVNSVGTRIWSASPASLNRCKAQLVCRPSEAITEAGKVPFSSMCCKGRIVSKIQRAERPEVCCRE